MSDTCDRRPIVNYNGPPFLPVGEITDIVWTARDARPVDINGGNYCPDEPVSRAQMAVFLVRTFDL